MNFGFFLPLMVQGQVISEGIKYGCIEQISGDSWPLLPPTGWRYAAGRVKALLHGKGAICADCTKISTSADHCSRPTTCAPVHMTICTGQAAYPLTDDLWKTYTAYDRMRLVATTTNYHPFQPYAQQEIAALDWIATEPAKRHELMQAVVAELAESFQTPAADTRTLLWDGTQRIPYPHSWTETLRLPSHDSGGDGPGPRAFTPPLPA